MTGTLSQLRPADPEGLRVLAARERTDDDTDYIYSRDTCPPDVGETPGGHPSYRRAPRYGRFKNRRGGQGGNARTMCVGRFRTTCEYILTYIHIYIYRGERVLKLCRYIYIYMYDV
jgi:hypothetical protein